MSASESSRVGSVIASKYRLDEELGRGGMGAVYRAFHLKVHKVFALKMLLGDIARHRSIASRFLLEAQAAGRIGHPGILDVYDVGEDADGTPFIVMELLRGEALSTLVRRERIDVEAACWIAMEVLDVLDAAHRVGIIHRDVKPQNVFITQLGGLPVGGEAPGPPPRNLGEEGGRVGGEAPDVGRRGVKLLDFGIAKFGHAMGEGSALTRSGEIIGSPLYMAPEQAKGEPDLDERADVWSVGAMLFEMLTGSCAHAATTPVAVLARILTEEAPLASTKDSRVTPELDAVVAKALRIDRAERWPSAKSLRDALAEVRAGLGATSLPKIPAAAKVSVPPPSNDRTPGAITSTVALPSSPPRAWSEVPASGPFDKTERDPARADTTVPSHAKSRTRTIALAVFALMLVAAFAPRFVAGFAAKSAPTSPSSLGGSGPPAESAALAPTAAVAAPAVSVVAPASVSIPPPAVVVPAVSVSVSIPVDALPSSPAKLAVPVPAAARCQTGEVLSNGHCCAKGLEWQSGRCERPLATTF